MTIMICAKLTFESINSQLLCRHLRDGCVADQGVDPRDSFQNFPGGSAHTCQIGQVHAHKAHISLCAKLFFQFFDSSGRFLRAAVQHHDLGPLGQEDARGLKSRTCVAPGDHIGFARQ